MKEMAIVSTFSNDNIMKTIGVCLEGSPFTKSGIEMLLITERTHYLVSVNGLINWTVENNKQVRLC